MFYNLVQNEWMKTNSKRQMFWFQVVFALITLLMAVIVKFFSRGMAEDLNAVDFASIVNMGIGLFIGVFAYVIGAVFMITSWYSSC